MEINNNLGLETTHLDSKLKDPINELTGQNEPDSNLISGVGFCVCSTPTVQLVASLPLLLLLLELVKPGHPAKTRTPSLPSACYLQPSPSVAYFSFSLDWEGFGTDGEGRRRQSTGKRGIGEASAVGVGGFGFSGLMVTTSPAQPPAAVGAVAATRRLGSSSPSLSRVGLQMQRRGEGSGFWGCRKCRAKPLPFLPFYFFFLFFNFGTLIINLAQYKLQLLSK